MLRFENSILMDKFGVHSIYAFMFYTFIWNKSTPPQRACSPKKYPDRPLYTSQLSKSVQPASSLRTTLFWALSWRGMYLVFLICCIDMEPVDLDYNFFQKCVPVVTSHSHSLPWFHPPLPTFSSSYLFFCSSLSEWVWSGHVQTKVAVCLSQE
jgi:hypothetical protein